jgi:hypothetical protein
MRKSQTLILSSNPANGAENVSEQGDRFTTIFQHPLRIGENATASILSASLWWSMANLSSSPPFNNNRFYYTDDINNVKKFVVDLPEGLYGITQLQSAINRHVKSLGQPDGLFKFSGVQETGKALITIAAIGWHIHFPDDNDAVTDKSIKFMLGFDESFPGTRAAPALTTTDSQYKIAENLTKLNSITNIQIASSLGGSAVANGRRTTALAAFPPTVTIGSLQTYAPVHPNIIPITDNQTIQSVQWWLTDQSGKLSSISTQEEWTATVLIEWD